MALSHELISQFAKIVKNDKKHNSESTVYGTVVTDGNGAKYVKLDGSDQLTPLTDDERPSADSTTTSANAGERVSVLIKNHTATVTGNISSPAVRTDDFNDLNDQVTDIKKFDIVLAGRVQANEGYIKNLQSDKANVGDLTAATARITELETKKASIEELNATKAEITDLKTTKIDADVANTKFATIDSLKSTNASITSLSAAHAAFETATTNKFTAVDADINNLKTTKLTAEQAELKFANINFGNITETAVKKLFTDSGIIKDLVVSEGHITGELVGVTIKGDLIEGGTVKADKLVVKGSDGLFYKLNTDGVTTTAEQTEYNSLSGTVITAQSITAEKINVDDLVAFDATIGGFNITESAIYSGVKSSANNTTRGIYQDKDGQLAVGDATNFLRYYKDQNENYKLEIAASSILFGSSSKSIETAINEISESAEANANDLANYITSTNASLEDLQGQIDGSIMTWFYGYEPTIENKPAEDWTTTTLKNNHLGDLFYDTITGYCYRWQVQNNNYSWGRITDVDVTKALADAATAQTTANNKRRVFVTTPTTPYDIGDLWAQGSDGELMRCKIAKTDSQSYASADWEKASKYTDDTVANAAQAEANALKTRVTNTETAISQNSEAIALRATKTEVKEEMSKLQVGGRNLLAGTSIHVIHVGTGSTNQVTNLYNTSTYYRDISNFNGKTFTLSFDWETTATSGTFLVQLNGTPGWDMCKKVTVSSSNKSGRSVFTFVGDSNLSTGNYNGVQIRSDNLTGTIIIKNAMFEAGNKPSSWQPAPEDVDDNINGIAENLNTTLTKTITDHVAALQANADSISASVEKLETSVTKNLDDLKENIKTVSNKVDLQLTEDKVNIQIEKKLQNGVTKVETSTGFKFDENGLNINKAESPTNTQITENGMSVKKTETGEDMLIANKNGVDAVNLRAKTYLIVGGRSRFENYGNNRTGCFWIGE